MINDLANLRKLKPNPAVEKDQEKGDLNPRISKRPSPEDSISLQVERMGEENSENMKGVWKFRKLGSSPLSSTQLRLMTPLLFQPHA